MTNKNETRKSYLSPRLKAVRFDEIGVISTTGSGEALDLELFDNKGYDINWEEGVS